MGSNPVTGKILRISKCNKLNSVMIRNIVFRNCMYSIMFQYIIEYMK